MTKRLREIMEADAIGARKIMQYNRTSGHHIKYGVRYGFTSCYDILMPLLGLLGPLLTKYTPIN